VVLGIAAVVGMFDSVMPERNFAGRTRLVNGDADMLGKNSWRDTVLAWICRVRRLGSKACWQQALSMTLDVLVEPV